MHCHHTRPRWTRALVPACAVLLVASAALAGDVFLGITMNDLSPSMARALQIDSGQGVLVEDVVDDSPAAAAGLQPGDVILAVAGDEISGAKGLARALGAHEPDDTIEVLVLRQGDRETLRVTLGERDQDRWPFSGKSKAPGSWSWFETDEDEDGNTVFRWRDGDGEERVVVKSGGWMVHGRGFLGIVPRDADRDELRELGVAEGRGVVVAEVIEGGAAEDAGLEADDVLVAIDDQRIDDGEELHEALAETEGGDTVTVRVIREGQPHEFEVELGDRPGDAPFGPAARAFVPPDPHAPRVPRFFETHRGLAPEVEVHRREEAREDLEELKDELAELKAELRKLREDLKRRR